jgi:hypothetical protein
MRQFGRAHAQHAQKSFHSSHDTLVVSTAISLTIAVINFFSNLIQLNSVFLLTALKHLMMIVQLVCSTVTHAASKFPMS